MNKKGQALVEFIIILPVMIFIGFIFVDFILISYNKQKLENLAVDIGQMYKNNEDEKEIKKFILKNNEEVTFEFKNNDKYIDVVINKEYDFITPGLSNLLKDFDIKIERTLYNE